MSINIMTPIRRLLSGKAPSPVPTLKPVAPAMSSIHVGEFNTGISEADVEKKACEDGQLGSLDPSFVGAENSHPHAIDQLVDGHDAATAAIGHTMRDEVQEIDRVLAHECGLVDRTEGEALDAIATNLSAEKQQLVQEQRMRAMGLPNPGRADVLRFTLLAVVLFAGDWGLLALGFQIMGLSDRPWISFLSFTDDLHLAALSAVMALVFLGHTVGDHVRRIEHAFKVRRLAGEDRDRFPRPARFDLAWAIIAFGVAVAGMFALSSIRSEYLADMGVDTNYWAFLGVQFLILSAAIAISFANTNPEAKRHKSVVRKGSAARTVRDKKVTDHVEAVGSHNAHLTQRNAVIAKGGHTVDADAANVQGQGSAYKRRYINSQLEPTHEQLFKEHKTPTSYGDGELLKRLTGITALPEFTPASTKTVMDALAAATQEISALRDRIDQAEIDKLNLPDAAERSAGENAASSGSTASAAAANSATDTTGATEMPAPAKLHPMPSTPADDDATEESA